MSRSKSIAHAPNNPLVIIRKDYLDMCEGDHCAAAILNVFEYWHGVKLANASQAEIENKIAAAEGSPLVEADLWVWKSIPDLISDLLGLFGETKVSKSLSYLCESGYLERRRNPKYSYDRTMQYRFNAEAIQAILRPPCRENTASMALNNGLSSRENTAAIPEITTETTSGEPLNASLEGVPSSSALDVPIPVQNKTLPPHMLVSIQQAVSVEPMDETPITLDHPLAKLYMDTFGLSKLTKQEVHLLSSRIYMLDENKESHSLNPLKQYWEDTTGFDEFVKERFAMAARAGNMKPVNVLENLRKFRKEGKWLGWLLWKDKNPSVTKTRKPNEPPKVVYVEMPDEAPKPWDVQS